MGHIAEWYPLRAFFHTAPAGRADTSTLSEGERLKRESGVGVSLTPVYTYVLQQLITFGNIPVRRDSHCAWACDGGIGGGVPTRRGAGGRIM